MAHVVDFKVSNLAGRKGVYTKRLNRDVNVFFGLNGSGKTSLLKILHSALSGDASMLAMVPFSSAEVTIYSEDYSKAFLYSFDKAEFKRQLDMFAGTDDVEFIERMRTFPGRYRREMRIDWKVSPSRQKTTGAWRHSYLPTIRLLRLARHPYRDAERSFEEEESFDLGFESSFERYWLDLFGGIQASVRQSQQKALVDILQEVLAMRKADAGRQGELDWKTAYAQMVSFLRRQSPRAKPKSEKQFRKRYKEDALLRNVVGRIDRVEREIGMAMAPKTKLEALVQRMFSGNKHLYFGEKSVDVVTDDDTPIGLRSLSSGEKHLLYILVETIRSEKSSLIVDEPEISMHIEWQGALLSAMRELNPEAQIIAATHSPEIIADLDDTKIFRL
ncbi:MAG: ATP-binding protein [Verrucomicrobia bacterium]|nr:ATP-binding protein [Verrucomicrobiota bacterium]